MKKTKLDKLALAVAIIGLILIAAFPVIIWDALGNGAQHFMKYGNPGVSGDSSGNSSATFCFGTFWTQNFNAIRLYAGQWRVVKGINATSGLEGLGAITFITVIGLIISCIYEICMPILNKILKENKILGKVDRYGKLVTSILCLFAIIFIGVPVIVMYTKIQKYGSDAFLVKDFPAYGGYKGIIEVVIALILLVVNSVKFGFSFKKEA
ncbi:MAG: hypothetical protein PUA56_01915 [Bacillales bacterium]|nr:hypothetical protein [Bacillales bacterium]